MGRETMRDELYRDLLYASQCENAAKEENGEGCKKVWFIKMS